MTKFKICTGKRVFYIFAGLFIILAFILLTRKSVHIDVMQNINKDEDSVVSAFAAKNDNIIHYESYQTGETVVDFNENTETFHADIGRLKYGVYMIRVEYKTVYDTSQGFNNPVCTFTLSGKNNDKFMYEVIQLHEYRTWVESPVWVTSVFGADDLHININYTGYGYCDISGITIYEYNPWKLGLLILVFFVFVIVFTAICKFYFADIKTRLSWFILGLLVLFSSYLCLTGNNRIISGDDFGFHISRIASMVNEIRYGHIPVLYQSDAIGGYGYISPLMYGNIFLYIPAFMHLLGMPLSDSYNMYIITVNCITCFICQYSFKRIFKKNRYAILGTALYLLSAYRIINIYVRSAVGEYTAMAFLPLIFYGFYKIYFEKEKIGFKDTIPLIIGGTGIIQSHVLTVEMSILFIGLFLIVHLRRTIRNIIPLLKAMFSVIGINLFFIVPFLDAYRQELNINANGFSSDISSSKMSFAQIFGFWIYTESRIIGFSLAIGIIIFLFVCICKKEFHFGKREEAAHRLAVECFLYGLLSIWLSSCYFPWEELAGKNNFILKVITSVQFSSRFLLFATVFLVVSTIYAVKTISEKELKTKGKNNSFTAMAVGLMIVCIVVDGNYYSDMMESDDLERILSKVSYISADGLYLPKGMGYYEMPETTVTINPENACFVEKRGTSKTNDKVFYVQEVLDECTVSLPIAYYTYLNVHDSLTGNRFDTKKGADGRLEIELKKGYQGEIIVSYDISTLWKISYLISFVCCIGIIVYVYLEKKMENGKKSRSPIHI